MKCNTCQNENYCYDGNHEITRYGCADNGFAAYVPQTNADRIRQMTDEELADFIGGIFTIETDIWGDYDPRLVVTQEPRVEIRDKEGMMEWLKAPVEEVDNGI